MTSEQLLYTVAEATGSASYVASEPGVDAFCAATQHLTEQPIRSLRQAEGTILSVLLVPDSETLSSLTRYHTATPARSRLLCLETSKGGNMGEPERSEAVKRILSALSETTGGLTTTDLQRAVSKSKATYQRARAELLAEGSIVNISDSHKPLWCLATRVSPVS